MELKIFNNQYIENAFMDINFWRIDNPRYIIYSIQILPQGDRYYSYVVYQGDSKSMKEYLNNKKD